MCGGHEQRLVRLPQLPRRVHLRGERQRKRRRRVRCRPPLPRRWQRRQRLPSRVLVRQRRAKHVPLCGVRVLLPRVVVQQSGQPLSRWLDVQRGRVDTLRVCSWRLLPAGVRRALDGGLLRGVPGRCHLRGRLRWCRHRRRRDVLLWGVQHRRVLQLRRGQLLHRRRRPSARLRRVQPRVHVRGRCRNSRDCSRGDVRGRRGRYVRALHVRRRRLLPRRIQLRHCVLHKLHCRVCMRRRQWRAGCMHLRLRLRLPCRRVRRLWRHVPSWVLLHLAERGPQGLWPDLLLRRWPERADHDPEVHRYSGALLQQHRVLRDGRRVSCGE